MNGPRGDERRPQLSWIGFPLLAVAGARAVIYYREEPALAAVMALLAAFGALYGLEPALSARFRRFPLLYFPAQTAILLLLARQQPFLDVIQILYLPLGLQAMHEFGRRGAATWLALFGVCLNVTLIAATGWLEGAAFSLLVMAAGAFLLSYDSLLARIESDRDESERLVAELQAAHEKLLEHAGQAEALAAMRERNRLARDLHDSVSQTIFAITLTSRAARLLLERARERAPERAPEGGPEGAPVGVRAKVEELQKLTAAALGQLRSLIAELRPPSTG